MRKPLQILLWLIKSALLLIALAALLLWPLSRGREIELIRERLTSTPQSSQWQRYRFECCDGRLILARYQRQYAGAAPSGLHPAATQTPNQPRWELRSPSGQWSESEWTTKSGPLRWLRFDRTDPDQSATFRGIAAPLWLIALAAGAWPALSLSLLVRRHLRHRRSRAQGLCEKCGYDLRATPTPPQQGGDVLAVCPECGFEVARASRP